MVIFSLLSVSLNSFLLYSYLPNLPFILSPLLFNFSPFHVISPFSSFLPFFPVHISSITLASFLISLSLSLFFVIYPSLFHLIYSSFRFFLSFHPPPRIIRSVPSLSLSPVSFIVLSVHLVRLSFSQIVDTPLLFAFL